MVKRQSKRGRPQAGRQPKAKAARGKREPRPAKQSAAPKDGRDALGRRWRSERRRIEEIRARLEPLTATGHHPAAAAAPAMARRLREELRLSRTAMAELSGLTRPGIAKLERGKGESSINSLGFLCRVFEIKLSTFFLRVEAEDEARRGDKPKPSFRGRGGAAAAKCAHGPPEKSPPRRSISRQRSCRGKAARPGRARKSGVSHSQ